MNDAKKKELFKDFINKQHVLIVDKSTSSRSRLMKTIIDLGGKRNQVHTVGHIAEASEILKTVTPQLVLSDYAIGGGSGFDLFKDIRTQFKEEKKMCLILITSNISQSAVAKAAEEDVDSFIIKPYTVQSLEANLINTVIAKLYPSKYIETIEKGKALLFEGKFQESLAIFDEALKLNQKPALALFYHGQAKYFLEVNEEAQGDYKKGLSFNNIHFKCQVGLFELFLKENKYNDAYEVVKNIAKYFPSNPDRLMQVIRLSIQTNHIEDIEAYYELFKELETRPDDVLRHMCAGMYIAGKYYYQKGDAQKANIIFDNLAVTCQGITKFLRGIITVLAKNNNYSEAKKHLPRFTGEGMSSLDFSIASYLAEHDSMSNGQKIKDGLVIYNSKEKDLDCFHIMIDAMIKENYGVKVLDLLDEARKLWPDENFDFYKSKLKKAA
jgi:CheY-like chemotaxis protein